MGLMDRIFGGGEGGVVNNAPVPPAGIAQPNAQNPTNAPRPAAPAAAANTPAAPAAAASAAPSSPLDSFKDFWQTPVDAEGKPVQVTNPAAVLSTDIFTFDPAKVTEQANALDFTKDINPELVSKALAGTQESPAALLELLNTVHQKSFAAATLNAGNMVNKAVIANNARIQTALPVAINAAQLSHTPNDNPVLSHPAVQPLVSALRTAAFNKDPNANPAEVAKRVNDYIMNLTEAMKQQDPVVVQQRQADAAKQTNWGEYFGG